MLNFRVWFVKGEVEEAQTQPAARSKTLGCHQSVLRAPGHPGARRDLLPKGILAAQGEHWSTEILSFVFQASFLSELVEGSQETSQTTGLGGTGGRRGPEEAAGGWVWTGCLVPGKCNTVKIL